MLISVTTIPAAANIGVAAAYGDWAEWRGAMLQLAVNLSAIVLAGIATLFIQRRLYIAGAGPSPTRARRRAAARPQPHLGARSPQAPASAG